MGECEGVQTIRMGVPPDPDKDPPYPGVSAKAFDPSGALAAYRAALNMELKANAAGSEMRTKLDNNRGMPPKMRDRMGDLMPGHGSITTTYERLGYTFHPVTGLPCPPVKEHITPSMVSFAGRRSATPSAVGAMSSIAQKSVVGVKMKPEAHSRLSLLEAWEDQLLAMTCRPLPKSSISASAPNLGALWGNASAENDGEGSCLSMASASCLSKSLVSQSQVASRVSAVRPFGLKGENSKKKHTWYFDSRRGPSLMPPGVKSTGVASLRPMGEAK